MGAAAPAFRYVVWRYTGSPGLHACSTKPPLHQRPGPHPGGDPSPARGRGAPVPAQHRGAADLGRADARRARFGPNVLTSHRVTALGDLTRQLRSLAQWAIEEVEGSGQASFKVIWA